MTSTAGRDAGAASPASWPAVTAVVPTLGDRADLLSQTLRAIREQDYPGSVDCLVVLDRRSTDLGPAGPATGGHASGAAGGTGRDAWEQTVAVAEAAGAKVLENERAPGLAGSRNTGYLAATTDLVANCDDDDYWLPGKLRAQVAALASQPPAAIACCGVTVEYGQGLTDRVHPEPVVTFRDLLRSRIMALHVSTFVIRRAALLNGVGLVSEEIPGSRSEDYEFLLRAARHGPVVNVPRPYVHVRWHTQRRAMYGRWPVVAAALPWLLEKYPEFRTVPAGYARVAGQAAFAAAASGARSDAWRWVGRTISANPREPRAYITLGVLSGLLRPDAVVRWLHRRGKGL